MLEMAQLSSATMEILKDFGLRPGMSLDAVRAAMHENRHHGRSGGEGGPVEGMDGGAHLRIGENVYTPGEVKRLLDAQALPASREEAQPPDARARTLPQIEASIALHKENVVRGFLGIGRDLLDAKAQLNQHGAWMPWLERVGFNQSTANKYMKLAQEIQPGTYMATLPYSKALAILELPAGEREAFAQENDIDSKSAAEIRRLIRERDEAKAKAKAFQQSRDWAVAEKENALQEAEAWKQRYEDKPAMVQQVVEVPDDYQDLKMSVAHLAADLQDAASAAEEAEARANEAERQLRQLQAQGAGEEPDGFTRIQGAVNTFLMAVQMLPYNRTEISGLYNRQRYAALLRPVFDWDEEMRDALEGGVSLDAEGAVL